MKKYQQRKYAEIYEININILKSFLIECANENTINHNVNNQIKLTGKHLYIMFDDIL